MGLFDITNVTVDDSEVITDLNRRASNALSIYAPLLLHVLQEEAAPIEWGDLRSQHFVRKAGQLRLEAGFHEPQVEGSSPHRFRNYGRILHWGIDTVTPFRPKRSGKLGREWKPRRDGYGPNWIPKAIVLTQREMERALATAFRAGGLQVSSFTGP